MSDPRIEAAAIALLEVFQMRSQYAVASSPLALATVAISAADAADPAHRPRAVTTVEYGVTYVGEAGDLHTDWGYSEPPEIDKDGEVEVGKREWAKAYEIKSRPVTPETSIWQSDDCPWREATR